VLLQVDSANDLYEYPESVFVGEFIGSPKMNVVPGTLEVGTGAAMVSCLGVTTSLSAQMAARLEAVVTSGPVLVGVRPHDLHLPGGRLDEREAVNGLIDITEHTGTEVFATVDVPDQKLIARLPRSPLPQHGQGVQLAFNPDRILLFDVKSKRSLFGRNSERERISVG